jgi:hypothetical protein
MRAHHRAVEHLHQMRSLAGLGQELEKRLEYSRAAEPQEPLPDAVPLAELCWQGPPGDVLYCEKVQRLQELAIVLSGLAPTRLGRLEHLQHDLPIPSVIPVSIDRLPVAGRPLIR